MAEYALHVMNNKNDICLFRETNRTGDEEIEFDDTVLKGWKILSSGFKKKAQAGVAIVLAPHVKLEDFIYVKAGRIVVVRVIVNGIKLYFHVIRLIPSHTQSRQRMNSIDHY